ncbi:cellulose biosynthesis protein BcsE [Zobellella sp. DQSA1]|uniref:cellulose biosynthesis protein BcsE n=1 Tax=Zobellella sp. DQSA1 TaxID=3342386 RepID=UPI0035C1BC99
MAGLFSIGIRGLLDELLFMQAPGLYWLNVDRQYDAMLLSRQAIGAQADHAKVALLCAGGRALDVADGLGEGGPSRLPLFSLPDSEAAIVSLTEDLMRTLKPRGYLLILLTPLSLWQRLSEPLLRRWLTDTHGWLAQQGCTLMVIAHGAGGTALHTALLSRHRTLYGLGRLHSLQDSCLYQVDFWCNQAGVSARQQMKLTRAREEGWRVVPDSPQQPQPRNDEHQVLAELAALEDMPAPTELWRLFDGADALCDEGLKARTATLVFVLERGSAIEALAQRIHRLRQQRGNGLKLVVRELSACLRRIDERLLLTCGANLVVPHHAPLSRFLTLLDSIQGQVFARHLPADIGTLIDSMRPLRLKGVVSLERFQGALHDLMANPLLPEDGKGLLVSLCPVAGIRPGQVLTLCRMQRDGDLATVVGDRVFLFLFACAINELELTLGRIFRLSAAELFSHRVVWHQDRHVLEQLQGLNSRPGSTGGWAVHTDAGSLAETAETLSHPPRIRPEPSAIRLPVFRKEENA